MNAKKVDSHYFLENGMCFHFHTVRKAIHQALAIGIRYWFRGRTEDAIILQFT